MFLAFTEVIVDLWYFAIRGFKVDDKKPKNSFAKEPQKTELVNTVHSRSSTEQPTLESRLCYVSVEKLQCLQIASKKFDVVRGLLRYGDEVKVIQQKSEWSFVEASTVKGWVQTKNITSDAEEVFPTLKAGEHYNAEHAETTKLRKSIRDEMLGGELGLDLSAAEYIFYRLRRRGTSVAWPLERPRLPGVWQSILLDKRGVSISVSPKTGSIMESARNPESAVLGYVEAVNPDETIELSSVGFSHSGVYDCKQFTRAQWSDLKPVFISFT